MRTIPLVAAIIGVACVIAPEANAQYYPWCSIDSRIGAENCAFVTYGQCRSYISGIGGTCYRNPWNYVAPEPEYGRPYRKRKYVR